MKSVLASAVLPALIFASRAWAQDALLPSPGTTAEAERVVVTGSNIPSAGAVEANPVDSYRTEDIERLGVRTATDFVQKLPAVTGSSVNQNISNGGDGRVEINLRGIYPKDTLVLVDGRRVAPSLNGTSFGGTSVDIAALPFAVIDHVDILKDGASAIYGSDAVTGVFNVFFKHKFRGVELGFSYGNTNLGASNDAAQRSGYVLAGMGDDKTDIVVFADYDDRAAIYSRDRDISSNARYSRFGGLDVRSGSLEGRVGSFVFIPGSGQSSYGPNTPTPHAYPNARTDPEYQNRATVDPFSDRFRYNFAAVTPAIPAADRENFYGSFKRDLCDSYLQLFGDFKFSRSFYDTATAATPFVPDPFVINEQGTPLSPIGITVPLQNPFNPFTVADATLPLGAGPYAALPVTTGVLFRSMNTGPRSSKDTTLDHLFDIGLRGELANFGDYFNSWRWETNLRDDSVSWEQEQSGVANRLALREALADTNPATAFNPFALVANPRQSDPTLSNNIGPAYQPTEASLARVFTTIHNTSVNTLELEDFKLNGDVWQLPAGPISFALGVEHRRERYHFEPDALYRTFSALGAAAGIQPARGNRDVWATFQEIRIPVTSPTWNIPYLLYSLEVDVAEREEWYATTVLGVPNLHLNTRGQSDSQRPKFSIRWQPIDSSLTLRGTYSEAYRVPFLNELGPQGEEIFNSGFTVNSTGGAYTVRELLGGNPELRPEVAYDWSYGAVWSPRYLVAGLTLSATYWHIHERDIISPFSADFIARQPDLFPGRVTFQDPRPGHEHDRGNLVLEVDAPIFNVASVVTEGLDLEAIYELDTSRLGRGDWGTFTITTNATYLSRFDFAVTSGGKEISESGNFLDFGSLPHWRAYTSAFYNFAGLETGGTVHYVGQYNDLPGAAGTAPGNRKIREWTTVDVLGSYSFNVPCRSARSVPGYAKDPSAASTADCLSSWRSWLNGMTITIGVNNVVDQSPPFVAGASENGYDESNADIKGRFWYTAIKKRF